MRRKLAAALALILALIMIVAVLAPYIVKGETMDLPQVSETQSEPEDGNGTIYIEGQDRDFIQEIEDLNKTINTLTTKRNNLLSQYSNLVNQSEEKQAQINKLLTEMSELSEQIAELDASIEVQEGIIEGLKMEIFMMEAEIEVTTEKLEKAIANEAEYSEYLSMRLKQMYEQKEESYLEMLLSAESFAEFFCKLENIRQVYEYDKKVVKELRIIRDDIKIYKASIEEVNRTLKEDKAQEEQLRGELETTRNEQSALLVQYNERELKMEDELRVLVAKGNAKAEDIDEIDNQIAENKAKLVQVKAEQKEFRKKQEALAKAKEAMATRPELEDLDFFWPLWDEDLEYVNQGPGGPWGTYTLNGKKKHHYGCDTAAPVGTPIHAAESGTVLYAYTSGYNSGYGNLIVIQHTSKVQTWYGHCSRVIVTPGQHVNRGDIIGYVGSTGNSTGPHLHLEIIINGTDVNPELYICKSYYPKLN